MRMNWKEDVQGLAEQVMLWVSQSEAAKGRFTVPTMPMDPTPDRPLLQIEFLNGQSVLRLEPAGFAANQAPTKVHLYAYPTLRRVVLAGPDEKGDWEVQTSEGVRMNYSWTEGDFLPLLEELREKPSAAKSV